MKPEYYCMSRKYCPIFIVCLLYKIVKDLTLKVCGSGLIRILNTSYMFRNYGISFYAYSPLAGGILTGKYKFEEEKEKTISVGRCVP